jgi:pantothenate synthetase
MQIFNSYPTPIEVDYISLASMETGEEIKDDVLPIQDGVLLAGVIKMGTTRLLDNVILPPKSG